MAIFYLDTSALVKRYRRETGTEVVDAIFSSPAPEGRFFISSLCLLELTSAVWRLARGGALSEATASQILARFRQDVRDLISVWPLDQEIVAAAVGVVEDHRLRSADAIHLASALAIAGAETAAPVVLVASDRELLRAAERAGLPTIDPEDPAAVQQLTRLRA